MAIKVVTTGVQRGREEQSCVNSGKMGAGGPECVPFKEWEGEDKNSQISKTIFLVYST